MLSARRTLLACLPAALSPAAARAFRLEPAAPDVAADYGAAACSEEELHAALRAELDRLLEGRPLPEELAPRLAALARCPFCGCAVADAPDHGEQEPAPAG